MEVDEFLLARAREVEDDSERDFLVELVSEYRETPSGTTAYFLHRRAARFDQHPEWREEWR